VKRTAPPPPGLGARALALVVDAALIATFLLMGEFLVRALVFPVEEGSLRTAQELLERLHYSALGGAGLFLAVLWHAAGQLLGGTPGLSFAGALPQEQAEVPWNRTLRGWFTLLFVELTFFTGWLVTEVDVRTFLTNSDKAAGVIRGLLHPSGTVLFEGLVLLVQTLFLAFMATAFAIPPAFVLAFAAARNLTRESRAAKLVYTALRTAMNLTRAVEPLVWALVFISWVGIGPFAGVLALWVHSVASLVKLYSEQIESIDRGPMDAIKATGAGTLQVLRYGVVPQVIPPFLSFTIYRWDINVRMSTIIGFVGGGGIGYILKPRVDLGEWGEVGTLVLLIAVAVWVMDLVSARIRERIV
jgi:phosphonate transport system permease protein